MKNILKINILVFVFLIFCFNYVFCESDNCNFGTCGECISFASENDYCVWCAQDPFNGRRCRSLSSLNTTKSNTKNSWCKDEFVINPQPLMNVTQNQDFGVTDVDGIKVQFKPQVINIKARPGVPISFNMSYKPAKDFPIDVYYLMDVTYTMEPKMGDLKTRARMIHKQLSNYTNNVRLGVGSFIEKPGFPFVDLTKHNSHAFKNLVSLTDNMTQFTSMIEKFDTGSNFDDPEAGLDALMQVMACEKEIGWRKGARRIIILCTDSTYHSAGDGKIVGAIKPHDMNCHLENNTYTTSLVYDYPSVSQINKVASDGNFKIIFAITKNDDTGHTPENEYKALVQQILGAKYAKLEDGDGVLEIIKNAYNEAARSVQINFNPPDFIQLTTDCNSTSASKESTNCESTHVAPVVTIPGTLTIKSCPPNGIMEHAFTVVPVGLEDKLTIKLVIDCKCDCEKGVRVSSPKCNNAGAIQCGVCNCDPGRYGTDCRCNGTSTDQKDLEKCKLNVDDSRLCSGRGKCRCGKCEECPVGYSGDYCEFNDNSCPRPNNKLCFGKGVCIREQCKCDPHWTGKDCSCPDDQSACFAPYSNEVCSGNGVCRCGVCICNALAGKNETYSGAFCDNCEECAEKRCKELEDYALCNYEHMDNKTYCDQKNNGKTKDIGVFFLNKTEINDPKYYMAKWCKKELEGGNGTYMIFKYQYDDHNLELAIQKELELPPEANLWIAAGSALGLVLLIGILTVIIWKILVDLHDRREYRKFKSEAAAAGYDVSCVNPLYHDPAINFENPVYTNSCN